MLPFIPLVKLCAGNLQCSALHVVSFSSSISEVVNSDGESGDGSISKRKVKEGRTNSTLKYPWKFGLKPTNQPL